MHDKMNIQKLIYFCILSNTHMGIENENTRPFIHIIIKRTQKRHESNKTCSIHVCWKLYTMLIKGSLKNLNGEAHHVHGLKDTTQYISPNWCSDLTQL